MNYKVEQVNGQKIFSKFSLSGRPPRPKGTEVYASHLPRDVTGAELLSFFETIDEIYELRLMMEFSGFNRGFCFVTYNNIESSKRAIHILNGLYIGYKRIRVFKSLDNCRLFIKGFPEGKPLEAITLALSKIVEGIVNVTFTADKNEDTRHKHSVSVHVDFETHGQAMMARKLLWPAKQNLWGCQISADWSDPYLVNKFHDPGEYWPPTKSIVESPVNNKSPSQWTSIPSVLGGISIPLTESVTYGGDLDIARPTSKVKVKVCPVGDSKFKIYFY